jgi:hypothetical protein
VTIGKQRPSLLSTVSETAMMAMILVYQDCGTNLAFIAAIIFVSLLFVSTKLCKSLFGRWSKCSEPFQRSLSHNKTVRAALVVVKYVKTNREPEEIFISDQIRP